LFLACKSDQYLVLEFEESTEIAHHMKWKTPGFDPAIAYQPILPLYQTALFRPESTSSGLHAATAMQGLLRLQSPQGSILVFPATV
jgi:hypothetical protein